MAELVFNIYGYDFQTHVDVLKQSYLSAEDALSADIDRVIDEAFAYQQHLEQGGDFIGERDDDGSILWSQEHVLDLKHETAKEALTALRRAYVIPLYHAWERGARRWTKGGKHTKHEKLVADVTALGLSVHPRLEVLRCLVNLLKHPSDGWGEKLLKLEPQLLEPSLTTGKWKDWYEAVRLTNANLVDFFSVVKSSGPTVLTKFV